MRSIYTIYIYIYIYMHARMYVCMYVCMYRCIDVYVYIYIYVAMKRHELTRRVSLTVLVILYHSRSLFSTFQALYSGCGASCAVGISKLSNVYCSAGCSHNRYTPIPNEKA